MPKLLSATALAHVFPEGQKITGFTLEYDCELETAAFPSHAFTAIDCSFEPRIPAAPVTVLRTGVEGRRVTLETDPTEQTAWAIMNYTHEGEPNPLGPPICKSAPKGAGKPGAGAGQKAPGGPDLKKMGYTGPKQIRIEICQAVPLMAADGRTIPPAKIDCTTLSCPETGRFEPRQFRDIPYQLYIPQHYHANQSYPLVLFISDASARCTDPTIPLRQGIGGVVWASREDQAAHPCFVVCPAFGPEELLTRDDFTCHPKLYQVKELLDDIAAQYSIDPQRIYLTGQSMGCMASCELMCTYPDYFAGALLVAGQWDPERCGKAMARQNLWIMVSENDLKAHPGMDAVTAAIEENGGTVARLWWDASRPEELNALAWDAMKAPANVYYTVFRGDTVVPQDEEPNPGANHTCTWRTAYQIPAVRSWLLKCRKPEVCNQ